MRIERRRAIAGGRRACGRAAPGCRLPGCGRSRADRRYRRRSRRDRAAAPSRCRRAARSAAPRAPGAASSPRRSGATVTSWPSTSMPVRKSLLLEGGVGVAPQRRRRLGHRAGVALDLRFELDRRFVEIAALEGLVGGDGGEDGKGDERGGKAGADEREHRGSLPVWRRVVTHAMRRSPLSVQRLKVSRSWLRRERNVDGRAPHPPERPMAWPSAQRNVRSNH